MKDKIIFSISGGFQEHGKFLYKMSNLKAVDKLDGLTMCVGGWNGSMEVSYMTDSKYLPIILPWISDQECYLLINSAGIGSLHRPTDDYLFAVIGEWTEITEEERKELKGWTYRLDTGKSYACKR